MIKKNLFTLQKAFFLPQQLQVGVKCLTVDVTVQGRIDLTSYPDYYYNGYCEEHSKENNSCVYTGNTISYFELSPAPATTLLDFLGSTSIVQALAAMDPSFHTLITAISNEFVSDYYSDHFDPSPFNGYDIHMTCTVGNIDPSQICDDVTNAVYVTLSWVSYNNYS